MRKEMDHRELFKRFAKRGEKFDDDWCERILETILTRGFLVGRQEWDSGDPGAGAGTDVVREYLGLFFSSDDADNCGPYETFKEAAEAVGLFTITDATESIWVDPIRAKLNKKEKAAAIRAADAAARSAAVRRQKVTAQRHHLPPSAKMWRRDSAIVSQHDRQWHKLFRLTAGISEHEPLIACDGALAARCQSCSNLTVLR